MQEQKDFEVGGVHAFVVNGAAPVNVAVFDHGAEGIHGPLVAFNADNVQVRHQEQRSLLAVPLQPRNQVSAAGSRFIDLRGDALGCEDTLYVFRSTSFIARRVAGINPDQVGQKLHGFVLSGGKIRCGLREGGSEREQCNDGC